MRNDLFQPYLTKWYSIITRPPILLEKLENTELSEIEKHVENMMIKIYKLCEFLMDTKLKTVIKFYVHTYKSYKSCGYYKCDILIKSSLFFFLILKFKDQSIHEILQNIEKKVPEFLPEIAVLEYLLNSNSPVFYDLRVHLKTIVEIPYIHFYSGKSHCNDNEI